MFDTGFRPCPNRISVRSRLQQWSTEPISYTSPSHSSTFFFRMLTVYGCGCHWSGCLCFLGGGFFHCAEVSDEDRCRFLIASHQILNRFWDQVNQGMSDVCSKMTMIGIVGNIVVALVFCSQLIEPCGWLHQSSSSLVRVRSSSVRMDVDTLRYPMDYNFLGHFTPKDLTYRLSEQWLVSC